MAGLGWALLGVYLLQHCTEAHHSEAHPVIPELQSHPQHGWDQMPVNCLATWKGRGWSREQGSKSVKEGIGVCLRYHCQGNPCPQGGRGERAKVPTFHAQWSSSEAGACCVGVPYP